MTRSRRRLVIHEESSHPAYVVWELTLRCDHACRHCGSRAVHARDDELSTDEALKVVRALHEAGTREAVLVGGEAYLHEGFLDVVRALTQAGIRTGITTGGLGITSALAESMVDAGLKQASVSIDGLAQSHDALRAKVGSHAQAFAALRVLRATGITTTSNMQVNRVNLADLEAHYHALRDVGVVAWQVQITAPLGRAADRPAMLLQPWDLLELIPRLAALKKRAYADGIRIMLGNNLGYFGPEEALLRSQNEGDTDHFQGCMAGRFIMGIESNGDIKGCPSLQSSHYIGGNLRERSLDALWSESPEIRFTRDRDGSELWGYCAECAYREPCRGGCSFTAHAVTGRRGNNPYCYHRARQMRKRGRRERLVPAEPAAGLPFDYGRFEIVEEDFDAPEPTFAPKNLVRLTRKPKRDGV